MKKSKLLFLFFLISFIFTACGTNKTKELEDQILEHGQMQENATSELQKNNTNQISDENYKIYNEVMAELNKNASVPEEEIISKLAPNYNMTTEELTEFMLNNSATAEIVS